MAVIERAQPSLTGAFERHSWAITSESLAFWEALEVSRWYGACMRRALARMRLGFYVEEELLYPQLRAVGIVRPVDVMVAEHGPLWTLADEVDDLLHPNVSETQLHNVEDLLCEQRFVHEQRERRLLHPLMEYVLSRAVIAQAIEVLASGAMPAGWTCANAGAPADFDEGDGCGDQPDFPCNTDPTVGR